jgi:hypothetical protein
MKKVVILGCGALGSHVAMLLRNECDIRVVDFDRVEQKNLLSQFCGKASIGKNKAEALKQTMQFMWGVKIASVPHKLVADNAHQLLGDASLIIDCLDNGEGRRVIQNYVHGVVDDGGKIIETQPGLFTTERVVITTTDRPSCLHGALAADGQFGRAMWNENFVIDDEGVAGAATCEGGEFLPFVSVVASYLAYAAQQYLLDEKRIGFQIWPGGVSRI